MLRPPLSRPVPHGCLLAAAALAAWLVPSLPARADCVQVASDVTCTAADADGFGDGTQDGLNVSVEPGATVTNASGVDVIDLNDGNTVTVEATGSVTATGDGADAIVAGNGNTVTNSGTISASGMNGAGIRLGDGAMVTTNPGSQILVTGPGGVGIEIGNGGMLRNQGTISNGAAMPAGSVGIRMGDGNGGFPNPAADPPADFPLSSGAITLSGADGIGIDVGSNNTFESSSNVTVTGANAIGVRLGGSGNTFTNRGSIRVDGDMARALISAGDNTIVNFGTFQVANDAAGRLAILGSGGVETIENRGAILGSIDLMGGDDVLQLFTGSNLVSRIDDATPGLVDGGAGTDALSLLGTSGGALLDLDALTGFETLLIDTGGIWTLSGGDLTPTFTGGTTLQSGTLALADTVTLGGDYVQADGTTLLVVVDPTNTVDGHGRLDVAGNATLGMDLELAVFQASPILSSTSLTILSTGGTILGGTFANLPADTGVLSYSLTQSSTEIILNVVRASYASFAGTPNQEAVAGHLDQALPASPGADLNAALVVLDGLPAEALPDAYDQLHPEAYDAHTGALAAVGYALAGVAARERLWCKPPLSELRPGRYVEEPCGRGGFSVWLDALTGIHDRDTGSDWQTSDGSTQALVAGIDWRPDRRVVVSGWAGLSSVDLDVDGVGEGDFDTFEFGVSALGRVSGARARAAFGYGRGEHEQEREIAFGGIQRTARGEYDSNRVLGLLELGWLFELGGFSLEPQAALDVTWVQEEELTEDGGLDLGLELDERTNTLVSTSFGARLAYRHVQRAYVDPGPRWAQGVWTPELTGRWRSTWTGADREIDARLIGAPDAAGSFTSEARDTEQGAEVGARLTFHPHGGGGSVSVGYDGYFGDGGTAHRAGIELRLHF